MSVSFDKLQAQAPELVSLAKKAQFNLSKHGLDGQRAKVALCLDHSGSMRGVYADGQMQALAERVLAMTHATGRRQLHRRVLLRHRSLVRRRAHDRRLPGRGRPVARRQSTGPQRLRRRGPRRPRALRPDREDRRLRAARLRAVPSDGAATSRSAAETELREAAHYPAFWKFLSIGEEEIAFLQKLDDLTGRAVDNADYQPVPDLTLLKDQALFDLLLTEYDTWLVAARELGMLA